MSDDFKNIWPVTIFGVFAAFMVFCNLLLILSKVKPELFEKQNSESAISNVKVYTEMVESEHVVQDQTMTYFMDYDT